ncbi:MAG TPA: glycosyltransferase [Stellaceae bacterium]|nr:glycosyltransferase [Stellaceae bacterium]
MAKVVWEGEPSADSGPLVTYRLQCYRHENFVAEAVRSVFAQTYSPLEILITDDCSPDRTFDIITELAAGYRGPHRVVIHRSEQNRHNFGHANEGLPFIGGEFFLWLSGDDVAEPEQVERLVGAWRESGASGVWSNLRLIDANGAELGLMLAGDQPYSLDLSDYADGRFLDFHYAGACGYSRDVIDRYGPIPTALGAQGIEHEFGFRAALLGRKRYLPEPLVRSRRHPHRITIGDNEKDRRDDPMVVHERQLHVRLATLLRCRDLVTDVDGRLRHPDYADIARALGQQIVNETRRLLEFANFRELRRRGAERGEPPLQHSGLRYPPNGISLVRALPEHACNLVAAECKYFALPWALGSVEPCHLRNHRYPAVLSAWTEAQLLALLDDRSTPG